MLFFHGNVLGFFFCRFVGFWFLNKLKYPNVQIAQIQWEFEKKLLEAVTK